MGHSKFSATVFGLALLCNLGCGGSHRGSEAPSQAGEWSHPINLSGSQTNNSVQIHGVHIDDHGRGLAAWSESPFPEGWSGESWSRSFQPDGSWSAPRKQLASEIPTQLHQLNPGYPTFPVMLGAEETGWVISMPDRYSVRGAETGWTGRDCVASPESPSSPAGSSRVLGRTAENLEHLFVASNGKDSILAAWSKWDSAQGPILATNRYTTSVGWEPEATETSLTTEWKRPHGIAGVVTPGGTAFLAWSAEKSSLSGDSDPTLRVMSAGSGQGWSDPYEIAGPGSQVLGQIAMAAGPDETAALAWASIERGAKAIDLMVSIHKSGTGWSQPRSAAQVPASVSGDIALAFTGPDQLILAFLASDQPKSKLHTVRTIWYARGRWSRQQTHSQPSEQPCFGLASNGNGHAALVWREERGKDESTALAAISDEFGAWQPATILAVGAAGIGAVQQVAVAMGPNGTACALWDSRQDGLRTGWASWFKPKWQPTS